MIEIPPTFQNRPKPTITIEDRRVTTEGLYIPRNHQNALSPFYPEFLLTQLRDEPWFPQLEELVLEGALDFLTDQALVQALNIPLHELVEVTQKLRGLIQGPDPREMAKAVAKGLRSGGAESVSYRI